MSAPPSGHRTRDAVHTQLTALLDAGGPLAAAPAEVAAFCSERLLIELAEQYRAATPAAPADGRAVMVTAGPPGAGKSTIVRALAHGYRRIDPDEIKDLLLARLDRAGLLDTRFEYRLRDGDPVAPGELAGWVHRASTDVADRVRARSLADGENVLLEGTLAWPGLDAVYRRELAAAGYEQLTVVDVEVPLRTAVEQAVDRWWLGRTGGAPLGGRFVPDAVIVRFYPPGNPHVSVCAARARGLYAVGLDLQMTSELRLLGRDRNGPARTAIITPDGVRRWSLPGLGQADRAGARCVRCGRPLTSPASIARGLGPGCARP